MMSEMMCLPKKWCVIHLMLLSGALCCGCGGTDGLQNNGAVELEVSEGGDLSNRSDILSSQIGGDDTSDYLRIMYDAVGVVSEAEIVYISAPERGTVDGQLPDNLSEMYETNPSLTIEVALQYTIAILKNSNMIKGVENCDFIVVSCHARTLYPIDGVDSLNRYCHGNVGDRGVLMGEIDDRSNISITIDNGYRNILRSREMASNQIAGAGDYCVADRYFFIRDDGGLAVPRPDKLAGVGDQELYSQVITRLQNMGNEP